MRDFTKVSVAGLCAIFARAAMRSLLVFSCIFTCYGAQGIDDDFCLDEMFGHVGPTDFRETGRSAELAGEIETVMGIARNGVSGCGYYLKGKEHGSDHEQHYTLVFGGETPHNLPSGTKVVLHGKLNGAVLSIKSGSDPTNLQVTAEAPVVEAPSNLSVTVILVNFLDSTLAATPADIDWMVNSSPSSLSKYYFDTSYGKTTVTATVKGPYTINYNGTGSCDYGNWAVAADAKAGVSNGYRLYVLAPSGCGWGGLGYMPGQQCWINGSNWSWQDAYCHEFGHNLGMHHAYYAGYEYADHSDCMGNGQNPPHTNAPHSVQMGWMKAGTVTTISANGTYTYTLSAMENNTSVTQIIKFPKANESGMSYYLSYRAPIGLDASNLEGEYQYKTSVHHYSSGSTWTYLDGLCGDGQTYADAANKVFVTQLSHTATTSTISVRYGVISTPPTVAANASASPNPVTATTAALSVLGADDGGEPSLTYTWSVVSGPGAVSFSANGSNGAKSSTATFSSAGSYVLSATIRDIDTQTVTSNVTVTVNQTLTAMGIAPSSGVVAPNGILQFTATVNDQFGKPMATGQPSFTYSVGGGGTISSSGLFSAGAVEGGPFTVTASGGGFTGTASILVSNIGTVWVEDSIPAGGVAASSGGDTWSWVQGNPFSGSLCQESAIAAGAHQHYFTDATQTLAVGAGDALFAYVYLDPANPPSEVMLQWCDGPWEHRAYWGANALAWGTDGTTSRCYMGGLPSAGQWVRLQVQASAVALEGSTLTGMAFTLNDGRAWFDCAGKSSGSSTIAPSITTQPVNQSVTAPATATFSVAANGTPTPTYQWQSAPSGSSTFTAIGGATSTSYTTGATSTAMSGTQYRCVASNSAGIVYSNAVTLTVFGSSQTPIASWTLNDGTGSTAADSSGNGNPGTLMSGPAWTTGRVGNALAFNGTSYLQVADAPILEVGANGGDFSVGYWLYLQQGATGLWRSIAHKGNSDNDRTFAMWMHPDDNGIHYRIGTTNNFNEGGDSVGQVPVNAWTHIAYVKSTNVLKLYINGVQDSQVTLVGASVSNNGPIYFGKDPWFNGITGKLDEILLYNRALSGAEVVALASVGGSTNHAPVITTAADATPNPATAGQTVTLGVAASDSDGDSLSYAWSFGDSTSGSGTSAAHAYAAAGSYTAVATISDGNGGTASSSVGVTVNAVTNAPTITTQPVNRTVTAPATATFSVTASGSPTPTYQWQSAPSGSSTYTAIGGATSASYTTGATSTAMSGNQYRCVASNSAGSATSTAATLTVNAAAVAPAITTQPVNQTVTAPATATFSVTASGSPTPTFQWQSAPSGSSTYTAISGATSTSYTTGATSIAMSGMKYRCVASNSAGSATSTAATLTVNAPATPTASVVVSDAVISETGPDSGSYTITLSSAPAAPVTVSYTLTGRAQNGNDYVTLPTTATIAAGQTTATVTVTPINDSKFEKAETVILTLTSGTGYTVGAPASATLSIQDNDGLQQTAATVTTSTAPKEGGIVTYTAPTNAEWPTDLNTTWTWGDGSATLTVTGAVSANHAFATPGIYTVVATITDPATSATLRETFSVTVTATGSGGGGGGGSGGGGGGGGGCGAGSGLGCLLMVLACLVLPMTRQRGR